MRTLKEILETPVVIEGETGRFINALGGGIETAASWYPMFTHSSCERCRELLNELETLANAPAPDVDAALVANEECQELLAVVKAQNAGLLSACKSARDYIGKRAGSAWGLMTYTELDVSITNAETPQRPAHAELRRFFAEVSPQPLTAREEMERDTA